MDRSGDARVCGMCGRAIFATQAARKDPAGRWMHVVRPSDSEYADQSGRTRRLVRTRC